MFIRILLCVECSKVTVVATANNTKIKEQNQKEGGGGLFELTYNTQLQPARPPPAVRVVHCADYIWYVLFQLLFHLSQYFHLISNNLLTEIIYVYMCVNFVT